MRPIWSSTWIPIFVSTFTLMRVVLVFAITRLEILEMYFVTIQPASMLTNSLLFKHHKTHCGNLSTCCFLQRVHPPAQHQWLWRHHVQVGARVAGIYQNESVQRKLCSCRDHDHGAGARLETWVSAHMAQVQPCGAALIWHQAIFCSNTENILSCQLEHLLSSLWYRNTRLSTSFLSFSTALTSTPVLPKYFSLMYPQSTCHVTNMWMRISF